MVLQLSGENSQVYDAVWQQGEIAGFRLLQELKVSHGWNPRVIPSEVCEGRSVCILKSRKN